MLDVVFLCGGTAMLCAAALYYMYKKLKSEKTNRQSMEEGYDALESKYKLLQGQKTSSEVRLGKIGENMAPFFESWPYDPNEFRFLGNPIDGVQFNDDGVVLVEIKTGKSQLSTRQREIKKLVELGKVSFATYRINENGSFFKESTPVPKCEPDISEQYLIYPSPSGIEYAKKSVCS